MLKMFRGVIILSFYFLTVNSAPVVDEQIGCEEGEPSIGWLVHSMKHNGKALFFSQRRLLFSFGDDDSTTCFATTSVCYFIDMHRS